MAKVEILRHPTDDDWRRCKMLAMNTIGRDWDGEVTDVWKRRMLLAEHSPIRTLMFTIKVELPYWVSVHFVRHKFGVEHYISTQRNDRQSKYDRTKARQDATVVHVMDINAQELMHMAGVRLCEQASEETRDAMSCICKAVMKANPEFNGLLIPKCLRRGGCDEFEPCGLYARTKNAD